jgi:hypothetical protein
VSKLVNRRKYLKEKPWRAVLHANIRQTEDLFTNLRRDIKRLLAAKTHVSAIDKGMREHLRHCVQREMQSLSEEIGATAAKSNIDASKRVPTTDVRFARCALRCSPITAGCLIITAEG